MGLDGRTARIIWSTGTILRHSLYSFVFKVDPARRETLARLLSAFGPEGVTPDGLAFDRIDTVHFASATLFERPFLDPLLILECNFDGELDAFLDAFSQQALGLAPILNCRQGPSLTTAAEAAHALRKAAHKPYAGHVGGHDLSRKEILASEALVARIRAHIADKQDEFHRLRAPDAARALQRAFAADCPPLEPRRRGLKLGLAWLAAVPILAAALVLSPLLLIGAAAFLWAERREPVRERPQAGADHAAVNENRVGYAQNHFASIAPLKTGPVRWASLRLVMAMIAFLARLVFTRGSLGGIPSIHFAHWTVVDQGSSLVFFSNYGGTWESYLDDFIQKAAIGLTAVWSHCQGFPKSRWLVAGGARDERAFKRYARDSQAAEAVWYSAYPTLTMRRILNNRAIMEGLAGLSKAAPERWLARL
jgi:hypothetical protein